jgi:tetratricopeptide (TPR) repeat protein
MSSRQRYLRSRAALGLVLAAAALLAGCASAPGGPPGAAEPLPEPVIVRPVVVAERGVEEMLVAMKLLAEGNFRQAEANFEEILKVRPDIVEAHFNLGWVRQRLGRHEQAIEALQAGLARRPGDVNAQLLIAASQRELGRFGEAEATYRKLLEKAPDTAEAHLNLGVLYELYLFKPKLALEHYRRYQATHAAPDVRVAGWIAVLERQEAKP